ncbi:MAG: hypothetical protein ACPL8I_03240 [Chloroflexaceae bacterium]
MMITWRTAALPRRHSGPPRRPTEEPIALIAYRYGFLPARFQSRGMLHLIVQIEAIWEEAGRGRRADRRYFAVRCADGRRCTLFQNLRAGAWHVRW